MKEANDKIDNNHDEIILSENKERLVSYKGKQKQLELPYGIKTIAESAFAENTDIESIIIPASVTTIESRAFFSCISLKCVLFEGNVLEIGEDCFWGCESLKEITLPQGTKRIGRCSFNNCKSLTQFIIPGSLKCIEDDLFYGCDNLKDVFISEGVKKICTRAFRECNSLKEVYLPYSMEVVEAKAFPKIRSCYYENSNTVFEKDAFEDCDDDFRLYIPKGADIDKLGDSMPTTIINGYISDGMESYDIIRLSSNIVPNTDDIPLDNFLRGLDINRYHYRDKAGNLFSHYYTGIYANGRQSLLYFEKLSTVAISLLPKEYDILEGTKYVCDHAFWFGEDSMHDWEFDYTNKCPFESIKLPSSIIAIGRYAFAGTRIENIAFPEHLSHIDDFAFRNCKKLTSIVLPHSVSFIGTNPFKGAINLKLIESRSPHFIVISDCLINKDSGVLIHCFHHEESKNVPFIVPSMVKMIGDFAFECAIVHSVVIPSTVSHVGKGAFMNNKTIEEVTFESESTTIDDELFCECTNLKRVVLPKNIGKLGRHLFKGCSSLMEIEIPFHVREIGTNPFVGSGVEKIVNQSDNFVYENGVLYTKNKEKIISYVGATRNYTIEPTVNEIAEEAFSHCRFLESISIPDSVSIIGQEAFSYCSILKKVSIVGDNLKKIESGAFSGYSEPVDFHIPNAIIKEEKVLWTIDYSVIIKDNKNETENETWTDEQGVKYSADRRKVIKATKPLNEYTILDGTIEIGDNAFNFQPWAPSLMKLTIPNSVEKIGTNVFQYCKFQELTIPESVKTIGDDLFCECIYLQNVTIPSSLVSMEGNPFRLLRPSQFINYKPYAIFNNSKHYIIIDGMLCSSDRQRLVTCLYSDKVMLQMPDVKIIGKHSCADCRAAEVHIPKSVQIIEDNAFYDARIERVILPDSLTHIGKNAFAGSNLRSIHIPYSVRKIEESAFSCYWLTRVYINSRDISIAHNAFRSEKLQEIFVPYGYLNYFREMMPDHKRIIKESDEY